jgi:hypothetical protein
LIHKAERAALAGDPIAISLVPEQPEDFATTFKRIQQQRLRRLFFLPPATAALVAALAYGEAK